MKRKDLEHLIRAAAGVTNEYEFVIVGSQSILGAVPDAPPELLMSREADVYPRNRPDLADLIDGSLGELSSFDEHFGYYAQGVGPETAKLPDGWEGRLVKVQNQNTDLKIGYCLEPHDLAASKLAAARPKDFEFVKTMIKHGLVETDLLCARIGTLPLPQARRTELQDWVKRCHGHGQPTMAKVLAGDDLGAMDSGPTTHEKSGENSKPGNQKPSEQGGVDTQDLLNDDLGR